MTTETKALTLGVIAKELDCPIHKIEYLIRARRIEPVQRAGNLRVFSPSVLDVLRRELDAISQRTRSAQKEDKC